VPKTIGDGAIKLSLIETLPGKEMSVKKNLEKACEAARDVIDFAVLKVFGHFDIALIYETTDFESKLIQIGPIDGILRTSRNFSFRYDGGVNQNIFDILRSEAFASITFLKLNTQKAFCNLKSEIDFINMYLNKRDNLKRFVLGSLGWNELILFSLGENINKVVESSLWVTVTTASEMVHKPFSLICVNHTFLPSRVENREDVLSELNKVNAFNGTTLEATKPKISITALPSHIQKIRKFWEKDDKYEVYYSLGSEDIIIDASHKLTWAEFLSDILIFRSEFFKEVFSTKCKISYKDVFGENNIHPAETYIGESIGYDPGDLKNIFGECSISVASNLNTFRGQIQDKITGDAFSDMCLYPEFIIEKAEKIKRDTFDDRVAVETFSNQTISNLRRGAGLRLYGTHGTIEERVGQFNRLRGGVHRSLKAMHFMPYWATRRVFGEQWPGFISLSQDQFSNNNYVIKVPPKALWMPQLWWGIYHEIAHVFIENIENFISKDQEDLKIFMAQRNNKEAWANFIVELSAEYIGYEIGFYGDRDLFTRRLWLYLKELVPKKSLPSSLSIYAIRTWFVNYIDTYLTKFGDSAKYQTKDFLFRDIVEHIEKIKSICGDVDNAEFKCLYDEKYLTAGLFSNLIPKLMPWIYKEFLPNIKDLNCRGSEDEYLCDNTRSVLNSLREGVPWDGEVEYPEAVLYKLNQDDNWEFKTQIATILTFWNMYNKFCY